MIAGPLHLLRHSGYSDRVNCFWVRLAVVEWVTTLMLDLKDKTLPDPLLMHHCETDLHFGVRQLRFQIGQAA